VSQVVSNRQRNIKLLFHPVSCISTPDQWHHTAAFPRHLMCTSQTPPSERAYATSKSTSKLTFSELFWTEVGSAEKIVESKISSRRTCGGDDVTPLYFSQYYLFLELICLYSSFVVMATVFWHGCLPRTFWIFKSCSQNILFSSFHFSKFASVSVLFHPYIFDVK